VTDTAPSRFRVIERLGSGVMTEVHLCRLHGVEGFQKEVVVKRLAPEHADDPLLVRIFLDEARLVARLSHRNIVQVFEVGDGPEQGEPGPYLAMEYVKGVSLALVAARAHEAGKVHLGHFAKIVAGISDALAYAHAARDDNGEPLKIVQRDLDPARILVSREGIAKLLDFGMEPGSGPSRAQLHRTDVFRAGALLYELTTGTPPFPPDWQPPADLTPDAVRGHYRKPSEVIAGYPPDLERLVLAAIDPDGDNPRPSAQELSDRLEEFGASPQHRSGPRALAAWLRELFPEHYPPSRPSAAVEHDGQITATLRPPASRAFLSDDPIAEPPAPMRPLPSVVAALRLPEGAPIPPYPPAPPRRPATSGGFWKWAAFASIGFAVGSMFLSTRGRSPAPPATPPSLPSPPAPPPSSAGPGSGEPERAPAPEPLRTTPDRLGEDRDPAAPGGDRGGLPPDDPDRTRAAEKPTTLRPGPIGSRRTSRHHKGGRDRARSPQGSGRAVALQDPAPAHDPVSRPPESARAPASPPRETPAVAPSTPRSGSPPPSGPAAAPPRPTPAARGAPIVSATPRSPVPIPRLPRMVSSSDAEQVARACQAVENAAVSLAGVSPEYARGLTGPMRRGVHGGSPVYPIGMYYFVVREAALKHDSATAAANLAAAQSSGALLRFRDLPGIETQAR
jgi:serine/threonine protein kinase